MSTLRLMLVSLVICLLVPAAGACGRSAARDLPGSAWEAVSIDGIPTISGSYISLYLWPDGYMWGEAGINRYDSTWKAQEGTRIKFGVEPNVGAVTLVGGPEDLEKQEDSYLSALWDTSAFVIVDGRLKLYDASGKERIVFARIPGYELDMSKLPDTAWRLESLDGEAVSGNTSMTLFLDRYGNATGQAGPLWYEIGYRAPGDTSGTVGGGAGRIGAGPVGLAGKALSALESAGTCDLTGDTLVVFSANGVTATFRRHYTDYVRPSEVPRLSIGGGGSSWAYSFEDMAQLYAYSDLVVMGTGLGYAGLEQMRTGSGSLYSWRSAFRVETVLKGTAGDEILLTNTVYAAKDGGFHAFDTDPPVQAGERWLLFLRADSDGTYHENGPWGRYKIVDGKVYSMNRVIGNNDAYYSPGLDFNGEALGAFMAGVAGTIGSTILTFYEERLGIPSPVFQFHQAGQSGSLIGKLSPGWFAFGSVTLTVKRVASQDSDAELPMPAGLRVRMEPAQLTIQPGLEYRLAIRADTEADLPVGIYWLKVECRLGDSVVASRDVAVSIRSP